jgi:cyclopropane fatty-acyl-phospholipid synthase-like methyltransferase
VLNRLFKRKESFVSKSYWENRYKQGGNSGAGSYNKFAEFKAGVLNGAIAEYGINRVIEFGCGDGNQLAMLNIPNYIGLDVSETILKHCIDKFNNDKSKSFFIYSDKAFIDNQHIFQSDAAFSIDVIFHLVENEVYEKYLYDLFASALKLVVIYGADLDHPQVTSHEVYRKFTGHIEKNFSTWKLEKVIKNKYPAKDYNDTEGSLADFYLFTRK